ncbi:MAG TPA: IS3 family transposase [Clostridiales bacterium]|nr:IS3 family transposase [Clostridiales bacterium]
MAVKYLHDTEQYPIKKLCRLIHLNRSAYYKWLKRAPIQSQLLNEQIVEWIKELYEEQDGILGYRQMTIALNRGHNVQYNHKRIYRLMNILHLKSVCRKKRYTYIRSTPEVTAENILNREFHADRPNEKWLTDVTEFKYYVGVEVKKLYLSAILDLYDRRIVAYRIGSSNNNQLAFDTFDDAVAANPDAHPLFHSDRGYQYTSKTFHSKLEAAKMRQSMSRVGHYIDNGPMEGYWGILKSEMYYLRKFTSVEELTTAIENYISFYNTRRYQKRLRCMTPMELHCAA